MRLIGMLDSPYVRRIAVSLEFLGVSFQHEPISVFGAFAEFSAINPVVKAPTIVCDDGTVLMDSSLILQFVEATRTGGRSLWSPSRAELQQQMRAVGLALAACEKSVQIVYERNLRPASAQYEPWIERVSGQLLAAFSQLEILARQNPGLFLDRINQAGITAAIVWQFTQSMLAELVAGADHPQLAMLSEAMERTPQFLKYPPVGPGV